MGVFAAVAENHNVIPKNIASDSHESCTHGSRCSTTESAAWIIVLVPSVPDPVQQRSDTDAAPTRAKASAPQNRL
jgi:hypothetical protein